MRFSKKESLFSGVNKQVNYAIHSLEAATMDFGLDGKTAIVTGVANERA